MPRASSRSSCEGLRELVARGGRELLGRRRVVADPRAEEAQLHRDRDEPLLRAVVEVALEAAALGVARGDEALARGAQLREAGLGLGLQVLVLERDRGGGRHGLDELRVVVERGVVDEGGDLAAVVLDRHDAAVLAGLWHRDRRAVGPDVGVLAGDAVGDDELRVAERLRERALERGPAHHAQLAEEVGEAAAREPRAQESGEERERDRDQRRDRQPEQDVAAGPGDEVVRHERGEQGESPRAGDARQAARGAGAARPRATAGR